MNDKKNVDPKDYFQQMEPNAKGQSLKDRPLPENQFIHNGPFYKTVPFWVWPFLVAAIIVLGLGARGWYDKLWQKTVDKEPFMEVTNREFSVFLWQFPSFIRSNVSKKTGYIPGFYFDRENFDPRRGDDFVSAPPDLIFLYHTWKRLLASDYISRPISPEMFDEFLEQLPEWTPSQWKKAPSEYVKLIEKKMYEKIPDMETLSQKEFPLMVRQAFQGWRNYFKDGLEINEMNPTIEEVRHFLEKHPHYARPYWRNIGYIADQKIAGIDYLAVMLNDKITETEKIPKEQLAGFLKVSLFMNQKNKEK